MTYPEQRFKFEIKLAEALKKEVSPYSILANAVIDIINKDYGRALDGIEISRELSKTKLEKTEKQHFRLICQAVNELALLKIKEYETIPKIKK